MHRYLVIIFITGIFTFRLMAATIGGEPSHIEPNLANRDDILLFGAFESEDWTSKWGFSWNPHKNMSLVPDGFDGNALQIKLGKGLWGGTGSGILMSFNLSDFPDVPAFHEEVYFRYYIRLDPNFPYVQGGKIPGLHAHKHHGGGNHPNGSNGWSGRYMWGGTGEIYLYAYLPNLKGWGTNLKCDYTGKRAKLLKGKWHCIEQYVKLNTIGRADGKCYTWFDGNLCMKIDTLTYRTTDTPEGKEMGSSFHCFFGGAGEVWAPPYDTYIQFDNVVVANTYIGPRTGPGTVSSPKIETPGGTYSNAIDVVVSGPPNSKIRYTTNGDVPGYHSPLYEGPVRIVNDAIFKARAFSDDLHYSEPVTTKYEIREETSFYDTTIFSSGDAFVRNGSYADSNYGTGTTIYIKSASQNYERRGMVTFALDGVDPLKICSAKLRLYAASADDNQKVTVLETEGNWNENEITWNNKPEDGDVLKDPQTISAGQWTEWDVSNYISSRLYNGTNEIGFSLVSLSESFTFKSRESSSDTPQLVIQLSHEPFGVNYIGHKENHTVPDIRYLHKANTLQCETQKPLSIKIFDIEGKLVMRKNISKQQALPLSLSPGIYILRASKEDHIYRMKFMLQ